MKQWNDMNKQVSKQVPNYAFPYSNLEKRTFRSNDALEGNVCDWQ